MNATEQWSVLIVHSILVVSKLRLSKAALPIDFVIGRAERTTCIVAHFIVVACAFVFFAYLLWCSRCSLFCLEDGEKKLNTFSNQTIKYVMSWKIF